MSQPFSLRLPMIDGHGNFGSLDDGPAAPLRHVMTLLDHGLRFAVLGIPCDVAAIRNLGRIDARDETQVPFLSTIFCDCLPTE